MAERASRATINGDRRAPRPEGVGPVALAARLFFAAAAIVALVILVFLALAA
jgi:hypothetical protein